MYSQRGNTDVSTESEPHTNFFQRCVEVKSTISNSTNIATIDIETLYKYDVSKSQITSIMLTITKGFKKELSNCYLTRSFSEECYSALNLNLWFRINYSKLHNALHNSLLCHTVVLLST